MARRRAWGAQQYSRLSDYLQYDPMFTEWYYRVEHCAKGRTTTMLLNNQNQQTQGTNAPAHGVSHANRELQEIGTLWVNTAKNGSQYLSGYLSDGRKILIFPIQNSAGNAPDYSMHVATYTDEERKLLAEDAAKRAAEREAKRAGYQQAQQQQAQPAQQQAPQGSSLPL